MQRSSEYRVHSARLCVAALGAALLLSLVPVTYAGAADPRSVRFEHLSRDAGLSQAFVYTIVQDNQGFLWFGTQEGLNRYDGFEFTVFAHDPNDPGSLSDESIRTMIKTRDGTLWIGTDAGGLSRFDSATKTFTNYLHDPANPDSISSNRVRVLYEDRAGTLWVGTDGAGLDSFDRESKTFNHYVHDPTDPNSLSNAHIWGIVEDNSGALWIATDGGLNSYDSLTGTFTRYQSSAANPDSISDDRLRALYTDRTGTLWVGTAAGGLNRYDVETRTFERFLHDAEDAASISANRISAIFEDDAGVLWIGTVDGLNTWNPDTRNFTRYRSSPNDPYSLAHNMVLSINQDRSGVLWVGTYDGLSKWNPGVRAMLHYRSEAGDPESLSENTVTTFAEDPSGNIWIGTFGGGLNRLDRTSGTMTQLRHDPEVSKSVSSDRIMALLVDSRGVLWAGTRSAGLNRFDADSGEFERFRHDPQDPASISFDGITYLLEDDKGGLWVGTFGGGLNYFDRATQRFRHFRADPDNPDTLSSDRILTLHEDSDGALWVGTYGGGLNRLDRSSGAVTRIRAEPERRNGLSGDEIYMIQEDVNGDLWISAKGAGLNRWRSADRDTGNASFDRYSELDGLPSATIYSGVWDQQGYLWLSSSYGLSRLDIGTLEFRNFDPSHGLQGDEFNLSAGFAAADGELYFGGMAGFNAFRPELVGGNGRAPQVAITNFLSLNQPLEFSAAMDDGAPLELRHDEAVISLEFAALDYVAPDKSRYEYRLDGLDSDWVDAAAKRQVTYTNLPAGDYTFRVKAQNNDGVWSVQDATVSFRMLPAPWRTWWAYLVYLLILAGIIFAALRAQARRTENAAKLAYAEQLAESQARLKEAQRIASIGNWDWNIVTNELWWSDEIYRLFQLDPDSFGATYESFLEHVHPDDRSSVSRAVNRALRSNEPYSIDHRIVLPDGTERMVHERAEVSFSDDGRAIRMAGTVHDITERKQAENEIHRRADFQALLAQLTSELIRTQPEAVDQQLCDGLAMIGERYDLDAMSVRWFGEDRDSMCSFSRWERDGVASPFENVGREAAPWLAARMLDGDPIVINDVDALPAAAAAELALFRRRGTKSALIIPLTVDDSLEGAMTFTLTQAQRDWSTATVNELTLIADSVAGAIARARGVAEIRQLKDQLQEENLYLREEVRLAHGFGEVIGEDPALRKCLQAVEKVAPTDVAVLILGETGTGKELIARSVHKLSARRDGPLISVNCPALPANLIESELFGHEKGAFTGAQSQRRGRFEMAAGGTLFLDEIGELPLELQSKLLRVLQTGDFERLGGTETLHTDVRLIAATNRNLQQAIDRGEFRADLYYRISSFPIRLPPLRKRRDDIPLLAEHFVHKHAERFDKRVEAISATMINELMGYEWPGNVRELESIIERALISAEDDTVLDLPGPLRLIASMEQTKTDLEGEEVPDLFSMERSHIISVLDQTDWKISGRGGAADVLGIPSSTLRSKMKRLGIRRHDQ